MKHFYTLLILAFFTTNVYAFESYFGISNPYKSNTYYKEGSAQAAVQLVANYHCTVYKDWGAPNGLSPKSGYYPDSTGTRWYLEYECSEYPYTPTIWYQYATEFSCTGGKMFFEGGDACVTPPSCSSGSSLNTDTGVCESSCPAGEAMYILPNGLEACNKTCDTDTEWYRASDNTCNTQLECTEETPPPYSQYWWSSMDSYSCNDQTNCKEKTGWVDQNRTTTFTGRIGGNCGAHQDNDSGESGDDGGSDQGEQDQDPENPDNPADEYDDPSDGEQHPCEFDVNCTENYDGSKTTNNQDGTYTHEDQNGNTQTSNDPQRPYVNPQTGEFEQHGENGGSGNTDTNKSSDGKHSLGYDTCELFPENCVTNPDGTTSIDCTNMQPIAYDPRTYTPNPNDPCTSRYYPSTYGNDDGSPTYEPFNRDNGDGTTTHGDENGNVWTTDNNDGQTINGSPHDDDKTECPEGQICDTKMGGAGTDICEAPPICKEEDNFQCVTLRIQWEDHCRLTITPEYKDRTGVSAPLGEGDSNYFSEGSAGFGSVVNVDQDFISQAMNGWGLARSCPAPPTIDFKGTTFTLDNFYFCLMLEIAGDIMILFSLLAAGRMIIS